MVVTLITPIAMEQGLRFAIREGGKTSARALLQRSSSNTCKPTNQNSPQAFDYRLIDQSALEIVDTRSAPAR